MVTPNTVYFESVRLLLLWRVLEDNRTSNMVKSKRKVLNLEQRQDVFVYLYEIS